jgi:hypothetical protein
MVAEFHVGKKRKFRRCKMNKLDDDDRRLLAKYQAAFDRKRGPRAGDIVLMLDGNERRIAHDKLMGTNLPELSGEGSFNISETGVKYSAALTIHSASTLRRIPPGIKQGSLVDTGECREAPVWFFHHGELKAGGGVEAMLRVRVYKQVAV